MKRAVSLIEVTISVLIFSLLSVSLYSLLRGGLFVREKLEREQSTSQESYLILEKMAQELRNVVSFSKEDAGFKGDTENIELWTLLFDYSANQPKILNVTYNFKDGKLYKITKEPFKEEPLFSFDLLSNLTKVHFYYYDKDKKNWGSKWENKEKLPQSVRIDIVYRDEKGRENNLSKYVFIYR